MRKAALAAVALLGLLAGAANASVIASLTFTEPTGTVGPTDSIDVWVTLSLFASSDPLTYDATSDFPNGFDEEDMPALGFNDLTSEQEPFASYDYIGKYIGRGCNDTFTVSCSSPGSEYVYGNPMVLDSEFLDWDGTVNPGESIDFLLWTLSPADGTASAGTYELYDAYIGFTVYGVNANGDPLYADLLEFGTDCQDANCTFSRTVEAPVVPVPAAAWLLGSGLGLLGWFRRKAGLPI